MEAAQAAQEVLILGGGDGMAAREVLKYPTVKQVTVVDIDPAITDLGQHRAELRALNADALRASKVNIVNTDAMRFVEENRDFFDVIIIDLPDPNTETLSKLYSVPFYALCARRLRSNGVLATQATSPFFARKAFWCIVETIGATAAMNSPASTLFPAPYHLNIPSFGEWGFVMAGKRPLVPEQFEVSVATRFLNTEVLRSMFAFSNDIQPPPAGTVDINYLEHPILYTYYEQGWAQFNE
jgi:spermidine synthase